MWLIISSGQSLCLVDKLSQTLHDFFILAPYRRCNEKRLFMKTQNFAQSASSDIFLIQVEFDGNIHPLIQVYYLILVRYSETTRRIARKSYGHFENLGSRYQAIVGDYRPDLGSHCTISVPAILSSTCPERQYIPLDRHPY